MKFPERRDPARGEKCPSIAHEMFETECDRPPLDERELTGFIATQSRDQTTSTAGYDMTFSPINSSSVLWAVALLDFAKVLEDIHDEAC